MSSEDSAMLFPLTDSEIEELRKGKTIMKHYHNIHYPDDTVAVILGEKWRFEEYEYLLPRGINIAGVRIEGENFYKKLEDGIWKARQISPEGLPIYISFMKHSFFLELQERKKQ